MDKGSTADLAVRSYKIDTGGAGHGVSMAKLYLDLAFNATSCQITGTGRIEERIPPFAKLQCEMTGHYEAKPDKISVTLNCTPSDNPLRLISEMTLSTDWQSGTGNFRYFKNDQERGLPGIGHVSLL